MFAGLAAVVREVDFLGWYRQDRVAGAVLAQARVPLKSTAGRASWASGFLRPSEGKFTTVADRSCTFGLFDWVSRRVTDNVAIYTTQRIKVRERQRPLV